MARFQTRVNSDCKFAKSGIGVIISSYVPVLMEGRIIAGYARQCIVMSSPHFGRSSVKRYTASTAAKFTHRLDHEVSLQGAGRRVAGAR
jgi:hypothetical protein